MFGRDRSHFWAICRTDRAQDVVYDCFSPYFARRSKSRLYLLETQDVEVLQLYTNHFGATLDFS